MDEIKRENKLLLDKIMRNGPAGDGTNKRKGFSFNVRKKIFFKKNYFNFFLL